MSYLPSNWAWGLDAQGNPVPVDAAGNTIPPPPGAIAWAHIVTGSTTRPAVPVAIDAAGNPVPLPDGGSTGITMGQAVVAGGLIVLAALVFKRR